MTPRTKTKTKAKVHDVSAPAAIGALRRFAGRLPEVSEGIACEGTALEKVTMKVRNKAFLFVGRQDLMLKLRESLPRAQALAKAEPDRCKAGASGWVTLRFSDGRATADVQTLKIWIAESYSVVTGRPS